MKNDKVLTSIIPLNKECPLKIEDYFDIHSMSKSDIKSITTDIRAFLRGNWIGEALTENGDIAIMESTYSTFPIPLVKNELVSLGFKKWQIKTPMMHNNIRIIILYVDIEKNTEIIENKMLTCGWVKTRISDTVRMYDTALRAIEFEPLEQESMTWEAKRYKYLFHLSPVKNEKSILKNGIEPRSDNDYLSYPPRAHLMKGNVTKNIILLFGWRLFNENKKSDNGKYTLFKIDTASVPDEIDFYGDPRFEYGYFVKTPIPSECVSKCGEIVYNDKYNFNKSEIISNIPDDISLL